MENITWRNERRKVSALIPAEYNPRTLTEKQRADLTASIRQFSEVEPVVVNIDGTIIGGHQRAKIYADLGIEEIDVRVPSRKLDPDEERALNLRLNKNTGEWDWKKLGGFDQRMLAEVGFSRDEIAFSYDHVKVEEDDFDTDEAARNAKGTVKKGNLFELGDHRLMCGDSTNREDVARLMGEDRADMVFTDPPYNVNYSYAKYEAIHGSRKKKFMDGGKIFNDNKSETDFYAFLRDVLTNLYEFSKDDMAIYVCFATKSEIPFRIAFRDAGFLFSQTIIWLKERMILAMGQDYHRVYEPIMFGWKEGKRHYASKKITKERELWDLDRMEFEERLDVWYLHRDKSSEYIHPTQKPVRLPERAIKKNSPVGGVLLEPFNGSGSTMMACEQLGRRCMGMELDPRYVEAAIKRWESVTGKKANKLE